MRSTSKGQPRLALSVSSPASAAGPGRSGGRAATRPRLALTMGDPAGVGPELVLRGLSDPELAAMHDLTVVCDRAAMEFWSHRTSLPITGSVVDVGTRHGAIRPGSPDADGALAALRAVEMAARMCLEGEADAMVTAPVSKAAISATGMRFHGHSEFLAELTGADGFVMTFVHGASRIALATTHLPLSQVPAALTVDLVLQKLVVLSRGLHDWFGVSEPRIAVTALNPHAGEGGAFGREEELVISPAIEAARSRGVVVEGPFPADAAFVQRGASAETSSPFDATLAMYHDQGTVAAKILSAGRGVNVTIGLPIVRTSADHGTAFDLAGRGSPDTGSMFNAVRVAGEIALRLRG